MIKLAKNVVCQTIAGEMVLLDVSRGLYFDLNKTGTTMLGRLLEGISQDALADELSGRYAVSKEQLSADIETLIADLSGQQLVELT